MYREKTVKVSKSCILLNPQRHRAVVLIHNIYACKYIPSARRGVEVIYIMEPKNYEGNEKQLVFVDEHGSPIQEIKEIEALDYPNKQDGSDFLNFQSSMTIAMDSFARSIPMFAEAFENLIRLIKRLLAENEYYTKLGEIKNPRVAYLSKHAKTQRARIKNLKRLYEIGLRAERRDTHNN